MIMDRVINIGAAMLLDCIGDIDDIFLDEADTADIAAGIAVRKRFVRYGALAAAASVGIAATYWFIRAKRANAA